MRSMYSKDELLVNAARKRPKWKDLIDKVGTLSEDDIMALEEPKWVREALVILKHTGGISQKARLLNIIKEADAADAKQYNERFIQYEVRICTNAIDEITGSIPYNDDITWDISFSVGEPFLLRSDDVIVTAGEFYKLNKEEWNKLLTDSEVLDSMTLQDYFNYYKRVYLGSRL